MMTWTTACSTTPALAQTLGDAALVAAMLRFEAELARALADAGLAAPTAADAVARVAGALAPDLSALFADGARAGTLAIPLVKALAAAVRAEDPAAAAIVHLGATSQDVADTAFVLQARAALALIDADLARAVVAAAALARRFRAAPMLGRTLLQPATPVTFGLKAAQWALALAEVRAALRRAGVEASRLQFGGAAGTLGALGEAGPRVAERLAARLDLPLPPAPWHTRRGALAGLGAQAALAVAACAGLALDVALMSQPEIAEAFEPAEPGRGGSSAMPHKRNPVRCMQIRAAHARAPHLAATLIGASVHEHERALGGWQAEWAAAPELLALAGGAAAHAAAILEGLNVDTARMRANLDALRGLPMSEAAAAALAPSLGRDGAHARVEAAAAQVAAGGVTLAEALAADPRVASAVSGAQIAALARPENALGAATAFVDAALADLGL